MKAFLIKNWWVLIITFLAVFTLLYSSPANLIIPDIDHSIFHYFGQGIRNGLLPYRDIYDHKPPAIFYINAFGLSLGAGSRWGVWGIQCFSLLLAGWFGIKFLKKYFGTPPALIAISAFFLNLTFFHEGGNLTEEYALPFQFAALFFLGKWAEDKNRGLFSFLTGIAIAGATTFKQPLGGILVAVCAAMIYKIVSEKKWKKLWDFVFLGLGFVSVWLYWFAYFLFQGIFSLFWEQAFAYNFALSSIPTQKRIAAFFLEVQTLFTQSPYYRLGILSWLAVIPFLLIYEKNIGKIITSTWNKWLLMLAGLLAVYNGFFRRGLTLYQLSDLGKHQFILIFAGLFLFVIGFIWNHPKIRYSANLFLEKTSAGNNSSLWLPLIIAAIDLPVQLLLVSLSGNNFGHYYMSLLPSLTILIAFAGWNILNLTQQNKTMQYTWLTILTIILLTPGLVESMQKIHISRDRQSAAIADFVINQTEPGDKIFYWGNRVSVYNLSGTTSPSRYFFTDPLFLKGYTDKAQIDVFYQDLVNQPPKLILASDAFSRPLIYLDDPAECKNLEDPEYVYNWAKQIYGEKIFIPEDMEKIYTWICQNYSRETITLIEEDSWGITYYAYNPQER